MILEQYKHQCQPIGDFYLMSSVFNYVYISTLLNLVATTIMGWSVGPTSGRLDVRIPAATDLSRENR